MDALNQLKSSLADRYAIEREIGAGGMATVYLARDIRHDRLVALKLLNPELGAVLGVERFLAEIKVTANLQHPNLLPLFDSGEAEGLLFYVMPFVEGETLRARLNREKQLPVDEAIRIAVAIANALEYAHTHGVIHRDLKPENILLQSGEPVVADFGIALAVSKAGGNRITQTGLSLGTPNYMSPEQATGDRVIDGRSDIYSLGAMTYEMLTGEPPHTGNTSQAVIARMLTEKPRPIRTTRSAVPDYVEDAIQRSLEKLPADRFSSPKQFAEALLGRNVATAATGVRNTSRRAAPSWPTRLRDPLTLGLVLISLGLVGYVMLRRPAVTAAGPVVRFILTTPDSARAFDNFPWPAAISPDGSVVVYSAPGPSAGMLYARRTNQLEGHPIPGTEFGAQPIFSPDGEWVGYEANGKFRKVRLDGSAPITVTSAGSANGADWTTTDQIVVGSESNTRGLSKVSAAGGELAQFAMPEKAKGESDYVWPIAFPDGKRVVFAIWSGSLATAQLATVSLDGGDVSRLGLKGIRPLAVIGRTLIYLQADGAVMGAQLNGSGTAIDGHPTPVHDPVPVIAGNNGNSGIFVSPGGALITSTGGTRTQLAWQTRAGIETPVTKDVRAFNNPRLSPDGRRVAVEVAEQDKSSIWIYDIVTGTFSRLPSADAARSPMWTPDGQSVVYTGLGDSHERFAVWSQSADGGSPPKKLFDGRGLINSSVLSPDGKSVLFVALSNNTWDIFRVPLDSTPTIRTYLDSPASEIDPRFSPDVKWVTITADESGRNEIYARSFPYPSARVQISAGGGRSALWAADGKTIFYRQGAAVIAAHLETTPTLRVVSRDTVIAKSNFVTLGLDGDMDISRDGRFLGLTSNRDDFRLIVVPNWLQEMKQRLAGNRR